nr:hypothetical protein [Tanacetum cinerariifolium]
MLGHTPSSSLVAPFNHAYLCMDVTEHTIRPQIISFSDGSLKDGSKTAANQRSTFSSQTAGDSRALLVANSKESLANPGVTTPSVEDVSYIDLGNCDQKCHYCGCLFWYAERLKGANHFIEQIRAYNQMFAMTSFGAKVDDSVNKGRRPYVFKVSGQIYHWIGSLCLEEGHDLTFLQLYIYDTQDEVANRMQNFGGMHQHTLNPHIVEGLYRLDWVRKNQKELRSDYLLGLYDAVSRGDREGIQAGSMVMLPRTFIGGPRYMYNHYLDALIICRSLENSQYFSTFTCNVKWSEIKRYMARHLGLTPSDRADIVCRVFEQKVNDFIRFLKLEKPFGYMAAFLYTIEFQKRGLSHCHTLLWVSSRSKITDACQIDDYISAKIPDPAYDPTGYKVVTELMMHGPCGVVNPSAACPDRILAKVSKSIGDMSTLTDKQLIEVDKIKNYVDGRFVCPFEACWRIFDYPIYCREPAVQILNVHLENIQRVSFRNRDRIDIIVNMPEKKKMTLTKWYVYYDQNTDGRHLTYLDFPSEFAWSAKTKSWHRRVIKTKQSIGRLTYVHPSSGDLFYFRMLLCHKKVCKSPDEVQTINGKLLPTYRVACEALGLLGDDKEWDVALEESTVLATAAKLRIFGKSVNDFGLPLPPWDMLEDLKNKLLMEKRNYRHDLLSRDVIELVPKLNHDQKEVFTLITTVFEEGRQELLFVYGHGGLGKTCLWKTITSLERSQGKIVLAVASLGIASLLLPAGRTAHFRKTVILGGNFRQTLPARKGAAKEELIYASIANFYLWPHFKVYMLRENMILLRSDLSDEQRKRSEVFAKWLFDFGNGEICNNDQQDDEDTSYIIVLQEYCINVGKEGLSKLINFIYDDATLKAPTASTLQEKAIVCPKNDTTDEVNAKILSSTKGVMKTYLSKHKAIPLGKQTSETEMLYPMEYLNTLTFPGFSPHALQLNVGTPIMML